MDRENPGSMLMFDESGGCTFGQALPRNIAIVGSTTRNML